MLRVTSLRLQLSMVTIFSLCWPLILLCHVWTRFSSTSSHVFPISVGFQVTLFPRVGRAGPFTPPLSSDRFQEALDLDNCPFLCQAQVVPRWRSPLALQLWLLWRLGRSSWLRACKNPPVFPGRLLGCSWHEGIEARGSENKVTTAVEL